LGELTQDFLYVHQKTGGVIQATVNNIDSIVIYSFDGSTVTDIDGNIYNTVLIGTQIWMKENLKATKFNDGTTIPLVKNASEWSDLSTPAYCWYYSSQELFGNTYGALYNWYAINTRKLCPTGWHVPGNDEWGALIKYLGGDSVAGGKLKETGTIHWASPNSGATNETGFTALGSGFRYYDGLYTNMYVSSNWWSATQSCPTTAFLRYILYDNDDIITIRPEMTFGAAVRCIKD